MILKKKRRNNYNKSSDGKKERVNHATLHTYFPFRRCVVVVAVVIIDIAVIVLGSNIEQIVHKVYTIHSNAYACVYCICTNRVRVCVAQQMYSIY